MSPRRDLAVRLALGLWVAGWGWKVGFYVTHLLAPAVTVEALPPALLSPVVAAAAYLAPLLAAVTGVVLGGRAAAWAGAVGAAGALTLTAHVATYNDATFVTAFWAALWVVWAATRSEAEARAWGPRLAQAVVSLSFLGAVLGKLTPEYLSGEVFFQVYFLQKEVLFYPWLRATLHADALRALATAFSWAAIAGEGLLATAVLWRPRLALAASAAVCLGMVAVSTPYLFSVMAPLVGLCAGGWVLAGEPGGAWARLRDRVAAVGAQPEQREVVAGGVGGV